MNNIYITGFMCSGKSSVSKKLSKLMKRVVIDTDDEIENSLNMKITDIFDKQGENYFRSKETEILNRVSREENVIISTGGGIILNDINRIIMHKTGKIIFINPDFSIIEERLLKGKKTRPLLRDDIESIKKRYDERLPLYKDCDIEITPTDESPLTIAKKIIERL